MQAYKVKAPKIVLYRFECSGRRLRLGAVCKLTIEEAAELQGVDGVSVVPMPQPSDSSPSRQPRVLGSKGPFKTPAKMPAKTTVKKAMKPDSPPKETNDE